MTDQGSTSRQAGLLYLVVVVTGMFSLVYVPSRVNVPNNPLATLDNIIASEALFRLGIASFMVKQVAFLLLPFVLFRLLQRIDRSVAVLMVALAVVSVPIALVSLAHRLDALSILTAPQLGQAFAPGHLRALALLSLGEYRNGLLITNLFWGLWLFPFGYLVLRSGFLPKTLGILLMLGCIGYVIEVFGSVIAPHYADSHISSYALAPAAVGEIGICLWLLLMRVRQPSSGEIHADTNKEAT